MTRRFNYVENIFGKDMSGYTGASGFESDLSNDNMFDESEELEFAAELLAVSDEAALDNTIRRLIQSAVNAKGKSVRSTTGAAMGGILKGAAVHSLPFTGRTVRGAFAGQLGTDGVTSVVKAGRIFDLELEGISPEDQEFEIARRFVQFAGLAAKNAALATAAPAVAGAKKATVMAALRLAPGLIRLATAVPSKAAGADGFRRNHRGRDLIKPGASYLSTTTDREGNTMHDIDNTQDEFESYEYEYPEELEYYDEMETGDGFDDPASVEEELAYELLNVADEYELSSLFGKVISKAVPAAIKFAKSPKGKALGGVLKSVAKKALPAVGGALGTLIPIPGAGTALGTALGTAVSKALELELEGLDPEYQELETAKRIVRIAGDAAKRAALAPKRTNPVTTAKQAVKAATRKHAPMAASGLNVPMGRRNFVRNGRWTRQGNDIILHDTWRKT